MTNKAFSIRIFVPDGDPDGLRMVERSNWIGKALIFPRALLPEIKRREEFSQTGVYVLIGPREDGDGEAIYIGEGDPVLPRIENHYANKDFWTRGAFFVTSGSGLNKAQVQYLESRLLTLARDAKRAQLDNRNQSSLPSLHEADIADMDVFLENMLQILPLVGISAFERPKKPARRRPARLYCSGKGVRAEGYESNEGFVVLEGSQAHGETVRSMATRVPGYLELRDGLTEAGVLVPDGDHLRFAQDYSFSSPSAAAAVVLGRSANGRREWADAKGRELRAIQEAAVSAESS
jgi:hypothetical protein